MLELGNQTQQLWILLLLVEEVYVVPGPLVGYLVFEFYCLRVFGD
jgi:hypothetical protein